MHMIDTTWKKLPQEWLYEELYMHKINIEW